MIHQVSSFDSVLLLFCSGSITRSPIHSILALNDESWKWKMNLNIVYDSPQLLAIVSLLNVIEMLMQSYLFQHPRHPTYHHHHHIILILIITCRKVLQTSEEKRVPSLNRFLSGLASTPPNQSNIITCTSFSSQIIQWGKDQTRMIVYEHIWINLKQKMHSYI